MDLPPTNTTTFDQRGLLDKVFDLTGEAFEKFGNLFRGDSTEKKPPTPVNANQAKSLLMKSERAHIKKPSGEFNRELVMKVVDVDSTERNTVKKEVYSL